MFNLKDTQHEVLFKLCSSQFFQSDAESFLVLIKIVPVKLPVRVKMLLNKTSHHTGVANEIYGQDKMVIISQAWIEKI